MTWATWAAWAGVLAVIGGGVITAVFKIARWVLDTFIEWARGLGKRLDHFDDCLDDVRDRLARLEGPSPPYRRR